MNGRRHLVPSLVLVAFGLFALFYEIDRPLYFLLLNAIHVHPFPRPFLDTRFVTAQVECWSRGIDVYSRNPCDPLGRTLDYSPLWLRMPFLARSDAWTPALGLAVDVLFLLALFRMRWDIEDRFGVAVGVGSALSWATLYALERGNTDLLMFAAAVLFSRLRSGSVPARIGGYALVLAVGLLKFYPLTLLLVAVREPARRFVLLGVASVFLLLLFVAAFHAELARIGANMADGLFGDMFGARSLPFGLTTRFGFGTPWNRFAPPPLGRAAAAPDGVALDRAALGVLTAGAVFLAARCGRRPALRALLGRLDEPAGSLLLVGAVLVVGCFFGHQNIGYRAVLLLLPLPGLLRLGHAAPARGRARLLFRMTAALIVLVLWDGIVSRSAVGWLAMQVAWWSIATVLLLIAVGFLHDDVARVWSELGRPVRPTERRRGRAAPPA